MTVTVGSENQVWVRVRALPAPRPGANLLEPPNSRWWHDSHFPLHVASTWAPKSKNQGLAEIRVVGRIAASQRWAHPSPGGMWPHLTKGGAADTTGQSWNPIPEGSWIIGAGPTPPPPEAGDGKNMESLFTPQTQKHSHADSLIWAGETHFGLPTSRTGRWFTLVVCLGVVSCRRCRTVLGQTVGQLQATACFGVACKGTVSPWGTCVNDLMERITGCHPSETKCYSRNKNVTLFFIQLL